jgi:hypothetical protein
VCEAAEDDDASKSARPRRGNPTRDTDAGGDGDGLGCEKTAAEEGDGTEAAQWAQWNIRWDAERADWLPVPLEAPAPDAALRLRRKRLRQLRAQARADATVSLLAAGEAPPAAALPSGGRLLLPRCWADGLPAAPPAAPAEAASASSASAAGAVSSASFKALLEAEAQLARFFHTAGVGFVPTAGGVAITDKPGAEAAAATTTATTTEIRMAASGPLPAGVDRQSITAMMDVVDRTLKAASDALVDLEPIADRMKAGVDALAERRAAQVAEQYRRRQAEEARRRLCEEQERRRAAMRAALHRRIQAEREQRQRERESALMHAAGDGPLRPNATAVCRPVRCLSVPVVDAADMAGDAVGAAARILEALRQSARQSGPVPADGDRVTCAATPAALAEADVSPSAVATAALDGLAGLMAPDAEAVYHFAHLASTCQLTPAWRTLVSGLNAVERKQLQSQVLQQQGPSAAVAIETAGMQSVIRGIVDVVAAIRSSVATADSPVERGPSASATALTEALQTTFSIALSATPSSSAIFSSSSGERPIESTVDPDRHCIRMRFFPEVPAVARGGDGTAFPCFHLAETVLAGDNVDDEAGLEEEAQTEDLDAIVRREGVLDMSLDDVYELLKVAAKARKDSEAFAQQQEQHTAQRSCDDLRGTKHRDRRMSHYPPTAVLALRMTSGTAPTYLAVSVGSLWAFSKVAAAIDAEARVPALPPLLRALKVRALAAAASAAEMNVLLGRAQEGSINDPTVDAEKDYAGLLYRLSFGTSTAALMAHAGRSRRAQQDRDVLFVENRGKAAISITSATVGPSVAIGSDVQKNVLQFLPPADPKPFWPPAAVAELAYLPPKFRFTKSKEGSDSALGALTYAPQSLRARMQTEGRIPRSWWLTAKISPRAASAIEHLADLDTQVSNGLKRRAIGGQQGIIMERRGVFRNGTIRGISRFLSALTVHSCNATVVTSLQEAQSDWTSFSESLSLSVAASCGPRLRQLVGLVFPAAVAPALDAQVETNALSHAVLRSAVRQCIFIRYSVLFSRQRTLGALYLQSYKEWYRRNLQWARARRHRILEAKALRYGVSGLTGTPMPTALTFGGSTAMIGNSSAVGANDDVVARGAGPLGTAGLGTTVSNGSLSIAERATGRRAAAIAAAAAISATSTSGSSVGIGNAASAIGSSSLSRQTLVDSSVDMEADLPSDDEDLLYRPLEMLRSEAALHRRLELQSRRENEDTMYFRRAARIPEKIPLSLFSGKDKRLLRMRYNANARLTVDGAPMLCGGMPPHIPCAAIRPSISRMIEDLLVDEDRWMNGISAASHASAKGDIIAARPPRYGPKASVPGIMPISGTGFASGGAEGFSNDQRERRVPGALNPDELPHVRPGFLVSSADRNPRSVLMDAPLLLRGTGGNPESEQLFAHRPIDLSHPTSRCNISKRKTALWFGGCNCPVAVEVQSRHVNPWSDAEKLVFLDRFMQHPKDFGKLATYLPAKTAAECIALYYDIKQVAGFKGRLKGQQIAQKRKHHRSGWIQACGVARDIGIPVPADLVRALSGPGKVISAAGRISDIAYSRLFRHPGPYARVHALHKFVTVPMPVTACAGPVGLKSLPSASSAGDNLTTQSPARGCSASSGSGDIGMRRNDFVYMYGLGYVSLPWENRFRETVDRNDSDPLTFQPPPQLAAAGAGAGIAAALVRVYHGADAYTKSEAERAQRALDDHGSTEIDSMAGGLLSGNGLLPYLSRHGLVTTAEPIQATPPSLLPFANTLNGAIGSGPGAWTQARYPVLPSALQTLVTSLSQMARAVSDTAVAATLAINVSDAAIAKQQLFDSLANPEEGGQAPLPGSPVASEGDGIAQQSKKRRRSPSSDTDGDDAVTNTSRARMTENSAGGVVTLRLRKNETDVGDFLRAKRPRLSITVSYPCVSGTDVQSGEQISALPLWLPIFRALAMATAMQAMAAASDTRFSTLRSCDGPLATGLAWRLLANSSTEGNPACSLAFGLPAQNGAPNLALKSANESLVAGSVSIISAIESQRVVRKLLRVATADDDGEKGASTYSDGAFARIFPVSLRASLPWANMAPLETLIDALGIIVQAASATNRIDVCPQIEVIMNHLPDSSLRFFGFIAGELLSAALASAPALSEAVKGKHRRTDENVAAVKTSCTEAEKMILVRGVELLHEMGLWESTLPVSIQQLTLSLSQHSACTFVRDDGVVSSAPSAIASPMASPSAPRRPGSLPLPKMLQQSPGIGLTGASAFASGMMADATPGQFHTTSGPTVTLRYFEPLGCPNLYNGCGDIPGALPRAALITTARSPNFFNPSPLLSLHWRSSSAMASIQPLLTADTYQPYVFQPENYGSQRKNALRPRSAQDMHRTINPSMLAAIVSNKNNVADPVLMASGLVSLPFEGEKCDRGIIGDAAMPNKACRFANINVNVDLEDASDIEADGSNIIAWTDSHLDISLLEPTSKVRKDLVADPSCTVPSTAIPIIASSDATSTVADDRKSILSKGEIRHEHRPVLPPALLPQAAVPTACDAFLDKNLDLLTPSSSDPVHTVAAIATGTDMSESEAVVPVVVTWTREESDALISGLSKFGRTWHLYASILPHKTPLQIRSFVQANRTGLNLDSILSSTFGGESINADVGSPIVKPEDETVNDGDGQYQDDDGGDNNANDSIGEMAECATTFEGSQAGLVREFSAAIQENNTAGSEKGSSYDGGDAHR